MTGNKKLTNESYEARLKMNTEHAQTNSNQIRVLLVHENELASSAWEKILSRSGQIKIVDAIVTMESYHLPEGKQPPEIIIASMSFLDTGGLRADRLKAIFGIRPRIIIFSEDKEGVKIAFKEGADWAAVEPIDAQDLITQVRALSGDSKKLCAEYRDRFSLTEQEDRFTKEYCDLVERTMQLIFHPDLVNPESVMLSSIPSQAGRLVFRNQARAHEFWIDARQVHQSKFVTVDIYNKMLEPRNITLLGKYLSITHGLLGLIVGRKSPSSDLNDISIALFENERKVILALGDPQLCEMLEYKAGGINPVCLLQDQYQNLIAMAGG